MSTCRGAAESHEAAEIKVIADGTAGYKQRILCGGCGRQLIAKRIVIELRAGKLPQAVVEFDGIEVDAIASLRDVVLLKPTKKGD